MSTGRSNASSNASTAEVTPVIEAAIARLRHCSQRDLRGGWRGIEADLPLRDALDPQHWLSWVPVPLNAKGHVSWTSGKQVLWLGQAIAVPNTLPANNGYPVNGLTLRLALRWWAEEAQVYVDGRLSQEGDIFDCFGRVLLHPSVEPGQNIHVALRLVSPGHDAGALVQSLALFEQPNASPDVFPQASPEPSPELGLEPGFIADEMAVLLRVLQHCDPDQLPVMAQALGRIPWDEVSNRPRFDAALAQIRQTLQPLGELVTQRQITLLGHAHLDLAWLWPIAETWGVAERTFESVLQLQDCFPELVFTHSTPALYAWIEAHRPALFRRICDRVQSGQWEIAAGLWVEPELTYVGGESIARQVLYGQRYTQERFGQHNRVAWLPDSFGFCGQLPQILRQGGIDYFASQKLRWNDTTTFPHEWFRWQSPDGSAVLGVNLPPIGTDIDPVQMASHLCDWETATGHQTALWLPGVGDHGGGPTADMLEQVRRWQRSPFFPQLAFGPVYGFLDQIPRDDIPTWTQDLYLEFHRGCYTTHPDQKRWNRRCERQLYEAELFAALATITVSSP
ncbi:MAG: alpha-mannosidase, partial [Elainellaceae cyanobacterium]